MNPLADPNTRHVMQGTVVVSDDPDKVLIAMLGSCVAACMRAPDLRIGGMNHFLLPGDDPRASGNVRYGARSMEELVNALLRRGADRQRLEVWLYGGANTLGGNTGIGQGNATFARNFVRDEGFILRDCDLGGSQGRRVRFHPRTGNVETALMQKAPIAKPVIPGPARPLIEFF